MRLRALCLVLRLVLSLALPETTERLSRGEPTWSPWAPDGRVPAEDALHC